MAEATQAASKARRRTFRWCRYCREVHDPGNLAERNVCTSCAEQYQSVAR